MKKTINIKELLDDRSIKEIKEYLTNQEGISNIEIINDRQTIEIEYDNNIINNKTIKEHLNTLEIKTIDTHHYLIIKIIISFLSAITIYRILEMVDKTIIINTKTNLITGFTILFVLGILTSMLYLINLESDLNKTRLIIQEEDNRIRFLYYLGRMFTYIIIGAILGYVGTFLNITASIKGALQIIVGILIMLISLNILNIPGYNYFGVKTARKIKKKILKINNPFYIGLLSGFIPCGIISVLKLYALISGGLINGGLTMFFFTIGSMCVTINLKKYRNILVKKLNKNAITIGAIIIITIGLSIFNNGIKIQKYKNESPMYVNQDIKYTEVRKDIQIVTTELTPVNYQSIIVYLNKPVKWIIIASEGSINDSNRKLIIPSFGIEKELVVGENIIEFNPTKEGTFTCQSSTGDKQSTISVITKLN